MSEKEILWPMVEKISSEPCPYCGWYHRAVISDIPGIYIELVGEACSEWIRLVHSKARKVLENCSKGKIPK